MEKNLNYATGYPNPMASKEEKEEKEFGIQYFKKMYAEWNGNNNSLLNIKSQRYDRTRKYSRGLQSVNKYKNLINSSGDTSYLNLDWTVIPIISKFVDVLVGSLTNQDYKVLCNAIDTVSTEKRKDDMMSMATDIMVKGFAAQLTEASGIPMGSAEGAPETNEELELHMQLNYKQATEIALEQGIDLAFTINDWEEISRRLIRDLVDINIAAAKTYLDANGIGIRYVDPKYLVTSHSTHPDFKDLLHVGEIRQITIQELKRIAGTQFTEEDYQDMAESYVSKNGNPTSLTSSTIGYSFESEKFTVDILDAEFKSVDIMHYEKKKNKYGGSTINKKSNKYKAPKKSKYKREQIKPQIETWYSGKWVIGTDYIFDYGLKENMLRPKNNLARTLGSYTVYSPDHSILDTKSIVERMIPFADQIQLIHLKMQQLIAKTRPKGMAIEVGSIEGVSKGEGGTFTPLEVQDIYEQTGNLYYRLQDDSGDPMHARPIQELSGGAGQYLQELMASYNYNLERIRDVSGINEVRDGSAPSNDALVGVQKLALLASNNATRGINHAYIHLMEGVANRAALALQDLVKYKGPYSGYISAIGETNMKTVNITKEISPIEVGIKIEALPDEIEIELLEQNIQQSLAQKELRLEDAIMIRNVKNIKLANQMLILRRRKYMQEQMEQAQQQSQMNAESQQQAAIVSAEVATKAEQIKNEGEMNIKQLEFQLKEQFAQAEHQRQLIVIERQGDIKLEHIQEAEDDSDLVRIKK
tara:strand:+ start:1455 stop:3722 length:2268 start_codon:yes stop_codon:yes gene_type:complete